MKLNVFFGVAAVVGSAGKVMAGPIVGCDSAIVAPELKASGSTIILDFDIGDRIARTDRLLGRARTTNPVPTPGSIALLGLGGLCMLHRRNRSRG